MVSANISKNAIPDTEIAFLKKNPNYELYNYLFTSIEIEDFNFKNIFKFSLC